MVRGSLLEPQQWVATPNPRMALPPDVGSSASAPCFFSLFVYCFAWEGKKDKNSHSSAFSCKLS